MHLRGAWKVSSMLLNNLQKILKLVLIGCVSAIEVMNQRNSSLRMIVDSGKILNRGICNAKKLHFAAKALDLLLRRSCLNAADATGFETRESSKYLRLKEFLFSV